MWNEKQGLRVRLMETWGADGGGGSRWRGGYADRLQREEKSGEHGSQREVFNELLSDET